MCCLLNLLCQACVLQGNGFSCRGVGAMELVAMDMKLRGMYIARQLSFHGVTFRIEEIPLEPSFKKVYDESVELVSHCSHGVQT